MVSRAATVSGVTTSEYYVNDGENVALVPRGTVGENISAERDEYEKSLPAEGTYSGGYWYLGEDYSFCERARQCGYKIMADTSIRLWHIGEYAYGWEDAGPARPGMTRSSL